MVATILLTKCLKHAWGDIACKINVYVYVHSVSLFICPHSVLMLTLLRVHYLKIIMSVNDDN